MVVKESLSWGSDKYTEAWMEQSHKDPGDDGEIEIDDEENNWKS